MSEYLQPFFKNKCNACEIYNCVNTNIKTNSYLREIQEDKGVGRIRYDGGILMSEHCLTVQECPTRKKIESVRRFTGSGLGWNIAKRITISSALWKLDEPINTKPDTLGGTW